MNRSGTGSSSTDGYKGSIDQTRKRFEESFAAGDFYDRQIKDFSHLERILKFIEIRDGMRILDLVCGRGYLSFPIAVDHPGCEVIGLDIVSEALSVNRRRAREEKIVNLSFVSYDGMDFPFASCTFDWILSRYALHHFPDIDRSMEEIRRCLKERGRLFISDPCPNDCDGERFVDDYMRLKKDGHIRFYTKNEWTLLCSRHRLHFIKGFENTILFPGKKDASVGWEEVLGKHDMSLIESYGLTETETELYITERVNNLVFGKE